MTQAEDLSRAVTRFVTAFSHLDWDLFVASFAANATVFYPFDDTPCRVDGIDAVAKRFGLFFEQVRAQNSGPDYLNLDPTAVEIETAGDVAMVTFHLRTDQALGRRSMFWIREGASWRIRHLHASRMAL